MSFVVCWDKNPLCAKWGPLKCFIYQTVHLYKKNLEKFILHSSKTFDLKTFVDGRLRV